MTLILACVIFSQPVAKKPVRRKLVPHSGSEMIGLFLKLTWSARVAHPSKLRFVPCLEPALEYAFQHFDRSAHIRAVGTTHFKARCVIGAAGPQCCVGVRGPVCRVPQQRQGPICLKLASVNDGDSLREPCSFKICGPCRCH